jgi:3-oxoacyl-[acyl-carrier-protein] synthase-3
MNAFLQAFGAHLPERVIGNAEIASQIGRTAEWIESVSGIQERRWASPDVSVTDLAVAAAQDCLLRTGVHASSLGLLIVTSGSAPGGFPGPAAAVAERLGLNSTPAFDVPMASAGSLFGMAIAARLAEAHGDILVVAAEKM